MATIQELLAFGKEQLINSGNEYAKYDRKVLLEEVLGCDYMYMLMHGDEPVDKEAEKRYRYLIERRSGHYPLQYLTNKAHFMDYTFFVNEDVLIPRSDTEILVETADEILAGMPEQPGGLAGQHSVLDLCCGSGCIGISLKLYHSEISLCLLDISEKALDVAGKNLEQYHLEAEVLCGDLLEPVKGRRFSMIISNPPYIEREVIQTLMPEVRDYEPVMALDGGQDGLDFYRRIIDGAAAHLTDGGCLMFEIGYNQGKQVAGMMEQAGFSEVVIKQDYAGLDRVVYGKIRFLSHN